MTLTSTPTFIPGSEVRNVTDAGLTVYWVTFGIMAFAAVTFFGLTLTKPIAERSHGYVTTLIVTIASCAYYAMASQGGSAAIGLSGSTTVYRTIFWARYVDWVLTTPLLLLDLALISAVPVGDFLWIAACDIFMILTGLFGATSSHRFKWGFYGAGCMFQVLLVIGMLWKGIPPARARSSRIGFVYTSLTLYLLILWWGYPIVWGLAEGSNTITIDAEVASYAGLDIATKVVFGFAVMASYPILSRQNKEEYASGRFLPSLLPAPINALLSPAAAYKAVPTVADSGLHHRNPNNGISAPQQETTSNAMPTSTATTRATDGSSTVV